MVIAILHFISTSRTYLHRWHHYWTIDNIYLPVVFDKWISTICFYICLCLIYVLTCWSFFTADLNNNINYVYCYLTIIHVQIEFIRICVFFNKTNYITLGPMFTICPRIRESLYFGSRQTTNFPHYRQIADHLQIMFTRRSNRGICQYFFLQCQPWFSIGTNLPGDHLPNNGVMFWFVLTNGFDQEDWNLKRLHTMMIVKWWHSLRWRFVAGDLSASIIKNGKDNFKAILLLLPNSDCLQQVEKEIRNAYEQWAKYISKSN